NHSKPTVADVGVRATLPPASTRRVATPVAPDPSRAQHPWRRSVPFVAPPEFALTSTAQWSVLDWLAPLLRIAPTDLSLTSAERWPDETRVQYARTGGSRVAVTIRHPTDLSRDASAWRIRASAGGEAWQTTVPSDTRIEY